jgi:hypothetical protein
VAAVVAVVVVVVDKQLLAVAVAVAVVLVLIPQKMNPFELLLISILIICIHKLAELGN